MAATSERRTHERVDVHDVIFVTFRPHFDKVGWLKDISKGGICMEYTVLDQAGGSHKNTSVDMFARDRTFRLLDLPCKVVYDVKVDHDDPWFTTVETRRCGIQFGGLNDSQNVELEKLLQRFKQQAKGYSNYEAESITIQ